MFIIYLPPLHLATGLEGGQQREVPLGTKLVQDSGKNRQARTKHQETSCDSHAQLRFPVEVPLILIGDQEEDRTAHEVMDDVPQLDGSFRNKPLESLSKYCQSPCNSKSEDIIAGLRGGPFFSINYTQNHRCYDTEEGHMPEIEGIFDFKGMRLAKIMKKQNEDPHHQ